MELPSLDPTRGNRYHTGTVLPVIWTIGLLSWALRATRSHQSRFTVTALLAITTVIAIGFVNVFASMVIVGYAMACDFGVQGVGSTRATKWKVLQVVAGVSAIAHASRVVYRAYLA